MDRPPLRPTGDLVCTLLAVPCHRDNTSLQPGLLLCQRVLAGFFPAMKIGRDAALALAEHLAQTPQESCPAPGEQEQGRQQSEPGSAAAPELDEADGDGGGSVGDLGVANDEDPVAASEGELDLD